MGGKAVFSVAGGGVEEELVCVDGTRSEGYMIGKVAG